MHTLFALVAVLFSIRPILCQPVAGDHVLLGPDDYSVWLPSQCPDKCKCSLQRSERFDGDLRTVDCSSLNLVAMPQKLPPETQVLLLENNKISDILGLQLYMPGLLQLDLSHNQINGRGLRTFMERLFNLRFLDLSGNKIRYLADFPFQSLENLQELDLSNNGLRSLALTAFYGLINLEVLNLANNNVQQVERGWWTPLSNLLSLSMEHNQIPLLDDTAFAGLNTLQTLDLSGNKIFQLNPQTFVGLEHLKYLVLSDNRLDHIPATAFSQIPLLTSLNMNNNPVFRIASGDFKESKHLKELSISGMERLRIIEAGAFESLPELSVIEIHDNPNLAYIDYQALKGCPSISHLMLHNNNLTVIDGQLVEQMESLKEISLYGNPFQCDCNLAWTAKLFESETSGKINLIESSRMICDQPQNLKFRLLKSVDYEHLGETCAPRIIPLFDHQYSRVKYGDDLAFDCRAVGVPTPKVRWQNAEPTFGTYSTKNRGETLLLRHMSRDNNGLYKCVAENSVGTAETTISVTVQQYSLKLQLVEAKATEAVFTWSGNIDAYDSVFQILYRKRDVPKFNSIAAPLLRTQTTSAYKTQYGGILTPQMNQFTLSDLEPSTLYEACLSYRDSTNVVIHVSCDTFTTSPASKSAAPIWKQVERSSNLAVGASLAIIVIMLILVALAAVGLKRVRSKVYGAKLDHCAFDQTMDPLVVHSVPSTPVHRTIPMLPPFHTLPRQAPPGANELSARQAAEQLLQKLHGSESCEPSGTSAFFPSGENVYYMEPSAITAPCSSSGVNRNNERRNRMKSTDILLDDQSECGTPFGAKTFFNHVET